MPDRRRVSFPTFDALESDVAALTRDGYTAVGKWDLPQILVHLARTMDSTTADRHGGIPRPIRWVLRATIKPLMFRGRRVPSGMPSTKELIPTESIPLESALGQFRSAAEKVKRLPGPTVDHPVFGHISAGDFQQFHLIHAEHHFGFLVPKTAGSGPAGVTPDDAAM